MRELPAKALSGLRELWTWWKVGVGYDAPFQQSKCIEFPSQLDGFKCKVSS